MNLIEFPLGPISPQGSNTFEVEHIVFDKKLKREVTRKLLVTGSDAFGLPRPIDDQLIMGMKALTYESGFKSRKVSFSRYRLCKILGWPTDGKTYKRIEAAFDRIAGTTLKFKDSWWDHGDSVWKSKTFHLIDEVELCSRDNLARARKDQNRVSGLSSFVWSDAIWKSFTDGYIKKVDMNLWRKVGSQRRKEVALRLYRILDKRFYRKLHVRFDVAKLCLGTLGISRNYAPSQMVRVVERASQWLVKCGFLRDFRIQQGATGLPEIVFIKANRNTTTQSAPNKSVGPERPNPVLKAYDNLPEKEQAKVFLAALEFGKAKKSAAYAGYQRNHSKAGKAFDSYRVQLVEQYLRDRIKHRKRQV